MNGTRTWKKLTALLAATALHFLLSYAVTVAACLVLGYGETLLACALGCLPLFLVLYVLIYLGITIAVRIQMKKINEKLQK